MINKQLFFPIIIGFAIGGALALEHIPYAWCVGFIVTVILYLKRKG